MPDRLAFYDLDGTLVSTNVVTQYAFFVRRLPSAWRAAFRTVRLALSVPVLIGLDLYSRRRFNEVFYRAYRGLSKQWLLETAESLFDAVIHPAIYRGAKALIERDRSEGYRLVLVTGSPDFVLAPVVRHFGFDHLIANSLVFENGVATGAIQPPLIAELEKVAAITRLCAQYNVDAGQARAYTDSLSDLPMLEAVGWPSVVHPGRRLRRIAQYKGWPILNLKS
jgi:HAD superfamily hydrolase (TIGR01490 family)